MSGTQYHLLDGVVCPRNGDDFANSSKNIGALFVRADGFTKYVEKQSPFDLLFSLFSKSECQSELWRELRPLMDTSETSFHVHIKYGNGAPDGEGQRHEYVLDPLSTPSNSATGRSPFEAYVQTKTDEGGQEPLSSDNAPANGTSKRSGIHWISIRTSFVSALIENDTVLFFHGDNPMFTAYLNEFLNLIPDVPGRFDLFVLDSLLAASLKIVKTQLQGLKHAVEATMVEARRIDPTRLFPVSRSVKRLHTTTRSMNLVLKSLVMGPMCASGEMRDILQSWYKGGEDVMSDLHTLMNELDEAREHINASMDQARNRYLVLEVLITIITLSFSFGALVSGIFGMNLRNSVEDDKNMFSIVVGSIILIGTLIVIFSFWYFYRSSPEAQFNKIYQFSKSYSDERHLLQQLLQNQDANRSLRSFDTERSGSSLPDGKGDHPVIHQGSLHCGTHEVLEKYESRRLNEIASSPDPDLLSTEEGTMSPKSKASASEWDDGGGTVGRQATAPVSVLVVPPGKPAKIAEYEDEVTIGLRPPDHFGPNTDAGSRTAPKAKKNRDLRRMRAGSKCSNMSSAHDEDWPSPASRTLLLQRSLAEAAEREQRQREKYNKHHVGGAHGRGYAEDEKPPDDRGDAAQHRGGPGEAAQPLRGHGSGHFGTAGHRGRKGDVLPNELDRGPEDLEVGNAGAVNDRKKGDNKNKKIEPDKEFEMV